MASASAASRAALSQKGGARQSAGPFLSAADSYSLFAVKGFVPTPPSVVDRLVEKLFQDRPPVPASHVLDPGCGPGAFIEGILRWCKRRGIAEPRIVGVEADSAHVATARRRFEGVASVEIRHGNFLTKSDEQFEYIIGNPPYVSILELSESERRRYREEYRAATNRFDLYALFFEQALRQLTPKGRLVFITPEKYLYVESAASLRRALADVSVDELHFFPENTFGDLVTYPLVTTVTKRRASVTAVANRDGETRTVTLPKQGQSWQSVILNGRPHEGPTLSDITVRVSCGVATGADDEFVLRESDIPAPLMPFAYPTISGRQLIAGNDPVVRDRLLTPYDSTGRLLDEHELGELGLYLSDPKRKARLLGRTCARRKPWYSFHENPPLLDLLRPKILCKDIGSSPHFFMDADGLIVPRHSVYYIVPKDAGIIHRLAAYLNADHARQWLVQNCQRAAGGFVRLQSHVLKRLPIPQDFIRAKGSSGAGASFETRRTDPRLSLE